MSAQTPAGSARHRHRHHIRSPRAWSLTLVASAVAGAMVLSVPAVATATPLPAQDAGGFSTSFESGDPTPLVSTVETGADGNPIQSGIVGAGGHLPGSVIDSATPITASVENPPGEVAKNLADADPATKWLAFSTTATLTYHLPTAAAVTSYALTSGLDAPQRDPAAWTLQGSGDGTTWANIDSHSAQTWPGRGIRTTYDVPVASVASFVYYRLAISAPISGGLLQLADWDLAVATTGSAAEPMVTTTGDGPTGGFNLKKRAGFTGLRAYHYAGKQTLDGHAYETNVVQHDLSVVVGPKTRLSYRIMPELTAGNLTYPSTYAAIDLHFTDGTYLSQLKPIDQHDVALTAAGQGTGKILYADQWNQESSDIGTRAAGRTVDRILLAYDDPKAITGTEFGGWIDDLTIDPAPKQADTSSLANLVDTRRGTNASSSFSRGNNLPISALPNGFTFFTPVTDANSNSWEYTYAQANDASNHPALQGLAVSHEPSPWMGDRNQLSVMPSIAATPTGSPSGRALAFTHEDETAQPDYYSVKLLNGIRAEIAPADHGGVFRFTFPANAANTGQLVFDTVDNNGSFVVDPATGTVTGWVDNGSGLSAGRSRMFFSGTFSTKPTATGTAAGGHVNTRYATFDTSANPTVELRLATSFIGLAQAQHNAELELTGRTFDLVRSAATAAWQKRLGVVSVKGETDIQRSTLYSNLYRLNLYPNSQFENTSSVGTPIYNYASPVAAPAGTATAIATGAKVMTGKIYVNNGFWDTYHTVWPAYSLLYPEVAAELIDGFVQQYRDGGWVARWSSPGYADLMTGTSSDVAFAGAYLRGVKLKDPLAAYDAALKNATVLPTSSGVGRKGLATSIFNKYTDTGTGESVSWALEGGINDQGLSNMAAALASDPATPKARRGQLKEEAAYLADRAGQYVNLFDPRIGFFQGRGADGSFDQAPADYDPESWGGVYTETNGWNFAFHAPQDGQGLADLYGGRTQLEQKLDEFFATPEKADKPGGYGGTIHEMIEARDVRMGQFGMSNQPSHHIPYMYDYVGAPAKTQALVREVMQRLYVGGEIGQGYTGDEDNGEMSSWYVLSSLGIYPLQSGSPNWAIGSPLFPSVTVHRSTGDLTIDAHNNSATNVYVQSLKVNGQRHDSTSLSTNDLKGTTHVEFTMGRDPSSWGTASKDAPTSPTTGDRAPTPKQDATKGGVGTVTAANGQDVSALTDDSSTTQVSFSGVIPALTWTSNGASQTVSTYTLTSGSAAGDPVAWTLEGSQNGSRWTTVDRRSEQVFPWRAQTRPFQVARPGSYKMYRLVVTRTTPPIGTTGSTPSLAEIELLVQPGTSGPSRLNVVPTTSTVNGRTGAPVTAMLATFSGGRGKSAADYTATVDWGDGGATSAGTITVGTLATYSVKASHTYAKPGYYRVTVSVSDGSTTATAAVPTTIALASTGGLVSSFNGVCIGDDGLGGANCDASGWSFSRQALAAAGVTQGVLAAVPDSTVNGHPLTFTLPDVAVGTPDNAKGSGQQIVVHLPSDATRISFIGTGTEGNQTATATLTYTDGTNEQVPMNFPDWTLGGGGSVPAGFTAVARCAYRLQGSAKDAAVPYLFAAPARQLLTGKTLASVTMPTQSGVEGDVGRVHLFAIADDGTSASPLAARPAADATATTGVAATATLLTATGGAVGIPRTARVQWGDPSDTGDATATTGTDGITTVIGTHTWTIPGVYTVHVTVADGTTSATVSLKVTVTNPAHQRLTVAPTPGVLPNRPVTLTGVGFRPGEQVVLRLAVPNAVQSNAIADKNGRIQATVVVPTRIGEGTYALTATGAASKMPATATITVIVPPLPVLTP